MKLYINHAVRSQAAFSVFTETGDDATYASFLLYQAKLSLDGIGKSQSVLKYQTITGSGTFRG